MRYNTYLKYVILVFFCITQVNCSYIKQITSYSKTQEGNYFDFNVIQKIQIGMHEKKILYILGNPLIKNFFNKKIWYYVFNDKNKKKSNEKKIFVLTFNEKDILISIEYRPNNWINDCKNC